VQAKYTDSYLQFVREFSAAGLVMAYALMTYQKSELVTGAAEAAIQISIVPFLATVMLLVKRMDEGGGAAPEELVLKDRAVLVSGFLWVLCFAASVYLSADATGI
jgi:decaprenyl-phosphate phosphoribosyltransferase